MVSVSWLKVRKAIEIIRVPRFRSALFRHGVAAATEHLSPISFAAANTLIDAGANKGQFSLAFRSLRPAAKIIAFEPLPAAADKFEELFSDDPLTELYRVALAGTSGTSHFHVADRTDSSSLLSPGIGQERAFGVRTARTTEVSVERLDACVNVDLVQRPVLLKVDVQGSELGVFEGCSQLEMIDYVYVELSFVELYDMQPLFSEVHTYLDRRGFIPAGFFNQVCTEEFGPTQVDVLFRRG